MSADSDVQVAELQKKLDEMKLYAVKHIQNFKSQVKTLTDELAGARIRGAEAIVTTNVSSVFLFRIFFFISYHHLWIL